MHGTFDVKLNGDQICVIPTQLYVERYIAINIYYLLFSTYHISMAGKNLHIIYYLAHIIFPWQVKICMINVLPAMEIRGVYTTVYTRCV